MRSQLLRRQEDELYHQKSTFVYTEYTENQTAVFLLEPKTKHYG